MENELRLTFSPEKPDTLTVELGGQTKQLSVQDVEHMIGALGHIRSQMQPEVAREFPRTGQGFDATPDPMWYTEANQLHHGSNLFLRHPGFGWLCFVLPPESMKGIQSYLEKQNALLESAPKSVN